MNDQIVEQLHKKAVTVGQLCRMLSVSRSGYYGTRQRAKLGPKACLVSTQVKAEFAASGKVYGSRRLCAVLRSQGLHIGRYRERRLMREHRLRALWRRKLVHTTDSGHPLPVSSNVLARRFDPSQPNQAWVSDITCIRTRSGWLYLAVVLDWTCTPASSSAGRWRRPCTPSWCAQHCNWPSRSANPPQG